MNRTCSVAGCDKPYLATGLCSLHWQRRKRYGNTEEVRTAWHGHVARPYIHKPSGYALILRDGQAVREHIAVAERALGKPLPVDAVVHHVNEIKDDNRPTNLVICPDRAYHALLHLRMRAQALGLPLDWRKCVFCKQYDDPRNMGIGKTKDGRVHDHFHRICRTEKQRTRRAQCSA